MSAYTRVQECMNCEWGKNNSSTKTCWAFPPQMWFFESFVAFILKKQSKNNHHASLLAQWLWIQYSEKVLILVPGEIVGFYSAFKDSKGKSISPPRC